VPRGRDDEEALTADIIAKAREYGRHGYRRVTALLRDAGWAVNVKRVERIWRREGLKVPQKQPKKGRLWLADGSCVRLRPERPNHVWSCDFVESRTHDGRKVRMLNLVDEFTRECLAIRVNRKLQFTDVIDVLADQFILRGVPAHIRSDNGPEFIATAVRGWIAAVGAKTAFIEPGSPWDRPQGGATARASTPSSATSCSTARSSTASRRRRSSSKAGASTTTPSAHTQPWAIGLPPRRSSSGRLRHPEPRRRPPPP
jgi:transposase InsO family protein